MANALLERAKERLAELEKRALTERTAPFILESAYEVLRETAQSLMVLQGFKPYSHEATIVFLSEYYSSLLSSSELFLFDRFRKLRSDSVYYAKLISQHDAERCLLLAKLLFQRTTKAI